LLCQLGIDCFSEDPETCTYCGHYSDHLKGKTTKTIHGNLGKRRTPEQRRRISEAHKGVKRAKKTLPE
jgi:hypothetical protein